VEVRRAELVLDHRPALEVVADGELHGDADAAMRLDCVLPDEVDRAGNLRLGQAHGRLALVRRQVELQRAHQRHRGDLFDLDENVRHAVLQHLELADRLAELLALFDVVERALVQLVAHPAGLAADRHGRFVGEQFDQVDPAGDVRITGDGDVLEVDLARLEAVDGRVIAAHDAGESGIDQEQLHARTLARGPAGARGNKEVRRPRRGIDHRLVAREHEARAIRLRGGADIGEVVAALRLGIGPCDHCVAGDDLGDHRIGHG